VANVQSSRFKLCISVFIANFPGPASSEITSQVNEIPRSLSLLSVYCNHSPPHMESMSFQPRRNLLQKNFSWASAVYPTTRECLPRMGIQSPCTCHCRRLPPGGVAISECVGVGVDIRWPDMSSRHPVRRRTDEDELKNITPLKDRLQFSQNAEVIVSPAESAKYGTTVHVDSSYEDLIDRATVDLAEALDVKMKKTCKSYHSRTHETGRCHHCQT